MRVTEAVVKTLAMIVAIMIACLILYAAYVRQEMRQYERSTQDNYKSALEVIERMKDRDKKLK